MARLRGAGPQIVVVLTLVAAVAGTALADEATTAKRKDKLTKKERKRVKKLADKRIAKAEPGLNVNSARSAASATNAGNADALGGKPPGAYANPDVAYGEISESGAMQPGARGISNAERVSNGQYCLQLAFTPKFGIGGPTGDATFNTSVLVDVPQTNCPPGTEATVYTGRTDTGTGVNEDFTVLFY